ncbi:MAG TPA: NAD(P)H-hydrate dehydratase, partial [Desulfuromonadales bacterium]
PGPVLILAGKGNNGGDGYVIARHLLGRGWRVRTVVLTDEARVSGDAAINLRALQSSAGELAFAPDDGRLSRALRENRDTRLVVDALFGTGLTSEVAGHYATAVDWVNAAGLPVLAVDIPSGIDATSGRILGRAVRADLTVTFALPKLGHALHPGADLCGDLEVVDIGIPAPLLNKARDRHLLVDAAAAHPLLPARPATGHKGTFGHLLVVAGSTGKAGAAAMTAEGGLRSGAGLVTVACPASVQAALAIKLTEAMTEPLAEVDGALSLQALAALQQFSEGKSALALGPGLGQHEETFALVRRLLRESPLPLVLDADGLNAVAEHPALLRERPPGSTVLTPHPGEMARLTGKSVAEVEADRVDVARKFARRHRVVLVLKGARTVTALPDGRVRLNGSGNPGLASGGMGDVLTGLIGGLLAQGLSPADAAVLGVYLHGRAADRLQKIMGNAGMIAGDLLRELPATRKELAEIAR